MMPVPLHGIDLVDLTAFKAAMEKGGRKFLDRIFTEQEQAYCSSLADPAGSYAARFAAKEAVAKALGTGIGKQARFLDIEVTRNPETRQPALILHGQAAETARNAGAETWLVSLSHTNNTAMASVLAYPG